MITEPIRKRAGAVGTIDMPAAERERESQRKGVRDATFSSTAGSDGLSDCMHSGVSTDLEVHRTREAALRRRNKTPHKDADNRSLLGLAFDAIDGLLNRTFEAGAFGIFE